MIGRKRIGRKRIGRKRIGRKRIGRKRIGRKRAGTLCFVALVACAAVGWRNLSAYERRGDASQAQRSQETQASQAGSEQTALCGVIRLAGSTSMGRLAGALAEGFMEEYPEVTVTVEFTGSGAGIEAVALEEADIGNSSRALSEREKAEGVTEHIVAWDGIAICVDPDNPVAALTGRQLTAIYTGEVNNWAQVGGEDFPIVTVGREAGSGTRKAFETLTGAGEDSVYAVVLDSAGAVKAKVAATPGAVGYISLETADDSVRLLTLEGVEPTVENVWTGNYGLVRPCIMATKGELSAQNRLVQAWFDYVLGEEGQGITKKAGFAPARQGADMGAETAGFHTIRRSGTKKEFVERAAQAVFTACALIACAAVAAITLYLVRSGIPGAVQAGWREILLGRAWAPAAEEPRYGIFYVILTSLVGTALAVLAGGGLGVLAAVFLAEVAGKRTAKAVRAALELLAGIPSVVYGLLGVCLVNPFIYRLELAVFRDSQTHRFTGGSNLLSASLVLAVMILPTVTSMSENALRAVPVAVREASLSLGASRVQTIFRAVLPAAKPGILAAMVLGMGRALGEASAIALVSGNSVNLPLPFSSVRFLTTAIVSEMGYAEGLHREVLFTVGLVLFVFILLLNAVVCGLWKEERR